MKIEKKKGGRKMNLKEKEEDGRKRERIAKEEKERYGKQ